MEMDKLQELEEKKKQLKELRERRQNHGGIIWNLVQRSTVENPVMISASVQTGQLESIENENKPIHKETITYDKSIQVDLIKEVTLQPDSIGIEVPEAHNVSIQEQDEETNSDAPREETISNTQLEMLDPLVIEDQGNTLHPMSFSILEVLRESYGSATIGNNDDFHPASGGQFQHLSDWESGLTRHEGGAKLMCISLDRYEELIIALFRSDPENKLNTSETTWSHVRVFKWDTGQLVDSLDFRGQTLLWARFLTQNTSTKVIPIIIATYTGKTILYELRCIGTSQNKRIERNLIIKNYHAHPIYAIDEYTNVVRGKERFLVASTNGIINELSPWDLSPYKDATSNTQPLWKTVVGPPRASEIYPLESDDDDDFNNENDEESVIEGNLHQQSFTNHLLRVSLYEELAISSLAICPSNQEHVYIGTEDGGIYKLELSKVTTNNSLIIHKSNHGFLPSAEIPIFHSSHVVSLLFSSDELLLSASLDWTCCLWDPKNNRKLGHFDVGAPIISIEWLSNKSSIILTHQTLFVIDWHISSSFDQRTRLITHRCTAPPQVERSLNNPKGNFTCFKIFSTGGSSTFLALGSSDDSTVQIYCFENSKIEL